MRLAILLGLAALFVLAVVRVLGAQAPTTNGPYVVGQVSPGSQRRELRAWSASFSKAGNWTRADGAYGLAVNDLNWKLAPPPHPVGVALHIVSAEIPESFCSVSEAEPALPNDQARLSAMTEDSGAQTRVGEELQPGFKVTSARVQHARDVAVLRFTSVPDASIPAGSRSRVLRKETARFWVARTSGVLWVDVDCATYSDAPERSHEISDVLDRLVIKGVRIS